MNSFSQRMGIKPLLDVVQLGSMNAELRNHLWNILDLKLFKASGFNEDRFTEAVWWHFFKRPVDERKIRSYGYGEGVDYTDVFDEIRIWFFSCEWCDIYDFVEFTLQVFPDNQDLRRYVSRALERESAGYRLIDGRFAPISDELEVAEIKDALQGPFHSVNEHLKTALALLVDRRKPDYRNSIKESISAVEAMAKIVSDQPKATLDDALKIMEKKGLLHPALKGAFSKLYGYTNDANGIRHALINEDVLNQADATYFLIACSAFINLLKAQMV